MLTIGMLDADLIDNGTRHPNLAQMKMSYYCKNKLGHSTELIFGDRLNKLDQYDLIIVSKVFTFTQLPLQLATILPQSEDELREHNTSIIDAVNEAKCANNKPIISIGGTGFFFDGGRDLDYDIEHCMPDYNLYNEYIQDMIDKGYKENTFDDYRYYSIGFTTRGCFRRCSFCVNRKYKRPYRNSQISEFLDETRPRIYLWDDNILSFGKGWEQIFNELNMTGKPFQFRQGIDIRLLTEKRAKILSRSNYYGDYIFAFDHVEDKPLITKRLKRWRKYCKQTTKLYVLCAFDPTVGVLSSGENLIDLEKQDVVNTLERIKTLMEFGCLPYVMRYEAYKNSHFKDMYIQLARWCNQPQFFKKKSFREFCTANQDYSKSNKECSSYKTMKDFEDKYPDVAKQYFDLRYDSVSKYDLSFDYGRIKIEPCDYCKEVSKQWDAIFGNSRDWIKDYYDHTLDITCLLRPNAGCKCASNIYSVCKRVVDTLLSLSHKEIIDIIDQYPITSIDVSTVPQYSDFEDSTTRLIEVLGEGQFTYEELGQKLYEGTNSHQSNTKYGENQAKLGTLLDLAIIREINDSIGKRKVVSISPLGKYISTLEPAIQDEILCKLCYRIEIIQQLIIHTKDNNEVKMLDILSKTGAKSSTITRRSPNVKELIERLISHCEPEAAFRLTRIIL